jgi:predicted O-methyltransferase YrrM
MQKRDQYDRIGLTFKKHWTFPYLIDRVKEYLYRKLNPDNPWLTPDAIEFIGNVIRKDHRVLEFGSGRSTLWFSKKCGSIISYEDDVAWYKFIHDSLQKQISDLEYTLIDKKEPYYNERFIEAIRNIPDDSIDLCLVDGCPRGLCALESVTKVRKGGYLVIDNVNWFLPSESRSPSSIKRESEIPVEFIEFYQMTKDWERVWTSNGVTDTLILIKP